MSAESLVQRNEVNPTALSERLASEALRATALGIDDQSLELDRAESEGPWRVRRFAHGVAREIGKREGMDLYDSLRFMFGVRKIVSNLRVIDRVREAEVE